MEILWKRTISTGFRMNRQILSPNRALHKISTPELGKIYVFYTVSQCYEKSAFRIMEGIEINENIGTKWVYV